MSSALEVSVVMPCLNEADTLATCVGKALRAMREAGISGEVVVADNGSTDGSQAIATGAGARVVPVAAKGYGNALMGGIRAAHGTFVIMGDADDSYDFLEVPRFVQRLREGHDLVMGCRLPSGGGKVLPGAMPFLHRWWGNPMFSWLARMWFKAPVHDVHCGMRGFRRDFWLALDQRCTGMEFATEMIIRASLGKARIAEVPITLHPDGRKAHGPHLRTFRDGFRHLRYYLMCSPRWLYVAPGLMLCGLGALAYVLALPNLRIGGLAFDANTLLFGSMGMLAGYQLLWFAFLTKLFAVGEGLLPASKFFDRLMGMATFKRGVLLGLAALAASGVLMGWAVLEWWHAGWGELSYPRTMRRVVPGVTLGVLGIQTMAASFMGSLLAMRRR